MGHTDPKFTLRIYARAMRRGDGERERLPAFVNGPAANGHQDSVGAQIQG